VDEVRRILAARPEAAREAGGARSWTPILYLCYTRLSHQPSIDNAVEIGRALLDHGANPNDEYAAGDAGYSALVGIAADGEQDAPRQPTAPAMFQLLLERGADPFSPQVLYNTHFRGEILWWLELVHAHTLKHGRASAWADATWPMFDMGGYGPGAYFLLHTAIEHNDLDLAAWVLSHGATPNAHTSPNPKFKPERTLLDEAICRGLTEMAELLTRHGATRRTGPAPSADTAMQEMLLEASVWLKRDEVRALLAANPKQRRAPFLLFAAASLDRPDVVQMLLDLGVPIEIQGRRRERALHQAAARDATRVLQLLIDRGAEIDARDAIYGNTPLGWATHFDHTRSIDLLAAASRDIWQLAFNGKVARLREVLESEPGLAKTLRDDVTPLWWLPVDEDKALEVIELFLAHGADPAHKNRKGGTAADWASTIGMRRAARSLIAAAAQTG
jgi:ankyrin repeat protein